jgi:hypothetical protein
MKSMNVKVAISAALLVGGMAVGNVASALSLNTTALKANSTLQFSEEAAMATSLVGISFTALGNTVVGAGTTSNNIFAPSFILPVTEADVSIGWNLKVSPNAGEAIGSALKVQRGSSQLTLANFQIDFKKDQVFADVITNGVTTNMAIYSFTEKTDLQIGLKGLGLTMKQTLGDLHLTTQAQDTFASALNLADPLKAVLGGLNFGSINIDISTSLRKPISDKPFTAAMMVPEPSTYALMALGMVGIAAVARRKQA